MNTKWDLDILYTGLDDPKYEADIAALQQAQADYHALVAQAPSMPERERLEALLNAQERTRALASNLMEYVSLRQSVEGENGELMAQMSRLMRILSEGAADNAAAKQLLGAAENIDALAAESPLIAQYRYVLEKAKKECSHLFSGEVEAMVSALSMTGGDAWSKLQSFLTSTVKVDYDGRQVTLSEIRNLAYSADAGVRKAAYEAELACYGKIRDAIAFALNNIKNEFILLSGKRGYASPLAQTLEQARMSRATLDAMMDAVKEYLPVFRKYLRRKGELLGHTNGLPWYDLFAPLGSSEKTYSLEEAKECLTTCFRGFTPDLADMMAEAFDNAWIDFYPANGKEGGAFCSGLRTLKQSRILTNYDGTFGAVDTLAHELGHAFHNRQQENEALLVQGSPMPVAETASTFNEVFLGAWALKQTAPEERLALLESDLREKTQCVVDIYSRYLFETAVFEQCGSKFLMASDLEKLMLECQEQSYGDGLDPDCRHPWMWACKSHYYMSGLSFYNFPYTFGNLFAQGLYALYLEQGEAFVPRYKEMLRLTGVHSIEEDGAMLGIDLTKPDFWRASLQSMADEIEEFCRL